MRKITVWMYVKMRAGDYSAIADVHRDAGLL